MSLSNTFAHNTYPSIEQDSCCLLDQLLHRIADQDQIAFSEFFLRTRRAVDGVATALLRDSGHAEEVSQEVFLEIWRKAPSFDSGRGSALSWVLRLTHSRAVDRVRHLQVRRGWDDQYARQPAAPDPATALDEFIARADQRHVRAAVATLSPLQQQALGMTFYQNLSYREASQLLRIPLPTLKSRVRDGLIALRLVVSNSCTVAGPVPPTEQNHLRQRPGRAPSQVGRGGQGRDRTGDLPLFRRTLVPTELPGQQNGPVHTLLVAMR